MGSTSQQSTSFGISTDVNASVIVGYNCAQMLAQGQSNTMIGYGAAQSSVTGNGNCVYGYSAAKMCAGTNNVYIGSMVVPLVSSGNNNLVAGSRAAPSLRYGSRNVVLGTGADTDNADTSDAVAIGGNGCIAGTRSTSIGSSAIATGIDSIAVGSSATAVGDGSFSIAGRLCGSFLAGNAGGADTYAVKVAASDAFLLGNGAALGFCPRTGASSKENESASWVIHLSTPTDPGSSNCDLEILSSTGTSIRFGNEFVPGVLDFTAQHSCRYIKDSLAPPAEECSSLAGHLVIATGRYVRPINVDDAVPCVELADTASDPRVFGVISGTQRPAGTFTLGHMTFCCANGKEKDDDYDDDCVVVTVNSAGEGGIWVCDEGGPIRNGDLLVSSSEVRGMAMRQPGPAVVCAATAAKATCDCDFDAGLTKTKLIGCVYKF